MTTNGRKPESKPASAPGRREISAQVASFDIFDTLITRPLAKASDAFLLMAQALAREGAIAESQIEEWARARLEAEARLRRERTGGEVELAEIARLLCRDDRWPALTAAAVEAVEIATEQALWRPIAGGRARVEQARRAGRQVVFVSDMYLPRAAIETGLDRLGISRAGDRFYISSELQRTKQSGDIFAHVAQDLAVEASAIHHVGDNAHSDVRMPRRAGLSAESFDDSRINAHEALVAADAGLPHRTRSLLAGAMRSARLMADAHGGRRAAIVSASAGVIAPMMLCYVLWCLGQAAELRRHRLFFLARDGQLLYKIAQLVVPSASAVSAYGSMQVNYLYGSRQAWHPAAIVNLDASDFEWLFNDESRSLSLAKLSYRLGVDAAALQPFLAPHLPGDPAARLSAEHMAALEQDMSHDSPLRAFVLGAAAVRRERVRRYLAREGALDASAAVLVDAGWQGNLQRSYERITASRDSCGLYIGLQRRPSIAAEATARSWLFDKARGEGPWHLPVIPLIETFLEADHGTTVDYRETGVSGPVPELKTPGNEPALAWGLLDQHGAALQVVAEFLRCARTEDLQVLSGSAGQRLCSSLLREFVCKPTSEAARHYGDFPKTNSQNHDDSTPLAGQLSWPEALRLVLARPGDGDTVSHWSYASLVRSGFEPLRKLQFARDSLRHRLRAWRAASRGHQPAGPIAGPPSAAPPA
jgi:FMN phosphatase YigB (HAD superfamily)